jgi:hypothetical protein
MFKRKTELHNQINIIEFQVPDKNLHLRWKVLFQAQIS